MIVFYFIICVAATMIGAITGVGGGVIIKPVLDAWSDMAIESISFMCGCTVLAMSVVSILGARKDGHLTLTGRGTWLALGASVGGVVGKLVFQVIKAAASHEGLVGVVQNVIMAFLTLGVLLYVIYKNRIKSQSLQNPFACILVGWMLGMVSAFLGIGGGPINLAVLYFFFSMDMKEAAINSLYIILFSQATSLISTFVTGVPAFSAPALAAMIAGGIIGGVSGRKIAGKLSDQKTEHVFRILLVGISLISVYNIFHYIGS